MARDTKDFKKMRREAQLRLRKLVEQRGVQPVTAEVLLSMGRVWPDDASVDDFQKARDLGKRG
jgi:hypothetical protein